MVCHVFSSFSSSLIRVLEAPLLLPAASASSSSSSSPASRSGGRRRRAAHVRPSPAIYPGRQELASHSSMLPTDFDIKVSYVP
jgi:hypothetical protein